ncbi:dihydrolipoyl dehydrogenase family protein [Salsipaludibacter albus]|uniref:dihydrolipoyl dehydrogenase family protein n=1 Tax=Salsipaludibacter albus TaxID=2849650 RepID=UPI001EE3F49B|nr:NAD(P)/FAD-dependent oxidoreductase [Salsipaludibacter albus]MBY5163942.1 NAD(P)/FAD-dependent oxidoreductase [Salsipaludibacter albus]
MSRTVDVVAIGAGAVGENVADYARQHGLDVVIVEADLVGGECSYWACMPSKALLRPTEVLAAARRVPGAAPAVTGEVDVAATLSSRTAFTSNWDDSSQVEWLESAGVELLRGHGRLTGEREVTVTHDDDTTTVLEATAGVVLATGSAPVEPPIDGLAETRTWDNRDVTSVSAIPDRLVVLGGGVVGVEMGQAMARLGSEVTIVEALDRLVATEEPDASEAVRESLEADGITVRLGAKATAVTRADDDAGEVVVTLDDDTEVRGDELLVAVGRRGRSDDVGLDTVGVEPGDSGFVEVDGHLRVPGHDWLSAVGDVNGRVLLTHQGKYQARLVGDRLGGVDVDEAWADDRAVPRVVFTDPQIAAVGLTEQGARDAGLSIRVVEHDTGGVAGGSLLGRDAGGPARLVVDTDRDVVVGATFVGPQVAELLHSATIAIAGEVPVSTLWHAVPAFPTVSEVWLRLLEALRD